MPEQEDFAVEQTLNNPYSWTPDKLELVPDSNVDVRLASGTWGYDVQASKDGVVGELVQDGKLRRVLQITATNAEVAAGLEAAGIADGMVALSKLRQALIKVAKAKLTA